MMGTIALYTSRIAEFFAPAGDAEQTAATRRFRPVTQIDPDTPLNQAPYVIFDTELTGLKPKKDSIVSIGAVKMEGNRINLGDTYYRLVEPRTKLTGSSVVIHGITPTEVSTWPSIDRLLPEFLDYCGSAIAVGHVVSIDLTFLNHDMKRIYGAPFPNPAVDTYALYRWLRKKEEQVCSYYDAVADISSLYALAEKYGISVNGAHNALSDAFVTAQLFQRFLSMLPQYGIATVGDLIRIGRP